MPFPLPTPVLLLRANKPLTSNDGSNWEFSPDELAATAAVHNALGLAVPMVPGHPSEAKEAELTFNKIVRFKADRQGLWALETENEPDPSFAALSRAGELGISLKLRPPQHKDNPYGVYLVKHAGALGLTEPADLSLRFSAATATDDGDLTLSSPPSKSMQLEELQQKVEQLEKDLELSNGKLKDLDAREAQILEREAQFSRANKYGPLLAGHLVKGTITAAEHGDLVGVFTYFDVEREIEFSGGDKKSPADILLGLLSRLTPIVTNERLGDPNPNDPAFSKGEGDPVANGKKIADYIKAEKAKGRNVTPVQAAKELKLTPTA